ncbi:MAG: hypothetical protein HEQ23_04010 [Tepidisphaera sp.]
MSNAAKKILVERPEWTRKIDEAIADANTAEARRRVELLRRLARSVSTRRDYWSSVSSGVEAAATARGLVLGFAIALTIIALLFYASTAFLSTGFLSAVGMCLSVPVGFLAIVLWIILLATYLNLNPAHHRVLARGGRCPDCGYDLRGTPSAVDPSELEGVKIGPRTCQECGCAWPLLFPPVPEEERATVFVRRGP